MDGDRNVPAPLQSLTGKGAFAVSVSFSFSPPDPSMAQSFPARFEFFPGGDMDPGFFEVIMQFRINHGLIISKSRLTRA